MDAEKMNDAGNKLIRVGVALLMLPVMVLVALVAIAMLVGMFM